MSYLRLRLYLSVSYHTESPIQYVRTCFFFLENTLPMFSILYFFPKYRLAMRRDSSFEINPCRIIQKIAFWDKVWVSPCDVVPVFDLFGICLPVVFLYLIGGILNGRIEEVRSIQGEILYELSTNLRMR